MKILQVILAILLGVTTSFLWGQLNPYGSIRSGLWYEAEDEDWNEEGESYFGLDYHLQGNSRFGFRMNHNDQHDSRVEFSRDGGIRLLWTRLNLGKLCLLVGQDASIIDHTGSMVYDGDGNFDEWGAISDGRVQQIRLDWKNGLSIALVSPELKEIEDSFGNSIEQVKSVLIPKVNIGYDFPAAENIGMNTVLGVNLYNTESAVFDETIFSYILGIMTEIDLSPIKLTLHGNIGQNTGNFGLGSQTPNRALFDLNNEKIVDVMTMGGFGELLYLLEENFIATLGASLNMSDSDLYAETDSVFSMFGQLRYELPNGLRIIPEAGYFNMMEDVEGNDLGGMFYLGTQLRIDF